MGCGHSEKFEVGNQSDLLELARAQRPSALLPGLRTTLRYTCLGSDARFQAFWLKTGEQRLLLRRNERQIVERAVQNDT
ncbi:unnamed protein product [Protopolystoma xenopodis]|uniref:Uncharacterized protein n=1 Tax=Protopolystoma xenopodis TaxID=117903 RepID=A0A3S5AJ82_9PLAT|nr:unnamed protein product [Protopolystoma xenopodis]